MSRASWDDLSVGTQYSGGKRPTFRENQWMRSWHDYHEEPAGLLQHARLLKDRLAQHPKIVMAHLMTKHFRDASVVARMDYQQQTLNRPEAKKHLLVTDVILSHFQLTNKVMSIFITLDIMSICWNTKIIWNALNKLH